MGISAGQIYRVRQGKRGINQKFIIGATQAFPGYKLDDLFYVQEAEVDQTPGGRRELIMNLLLRRPDMGYKEIADIVGCSRQRVHIVAKTAGLTRDQKPRNYRKDVTVERVLEFYHQGLLVKDIAQALSCNNFTVRMRLRAAGISKSECYSRSMKLDWRGRSSKIGAAVGGPE